MKMSILNKVVNWITCLSWASLLFVTLVVTVDVSGRFFFSRPLPGSVEMCQLLLPWIILPGFAFALLRDEHVRVTLVSDRFPAKAKVYVNAVMFLLGGIYFVAITIYGIVYFWESFKINEYLMAPIYLPWWASKLALPFGTFFFAIEYFLRIVLLFQKRETQIILRGGY
jgi:TRAP-type C4-dicarboxylate transport system permease small subunit